MLQAGKNITQVNDQLTKIQPEYLFNSVRNPKPEIVSAIKQLRVVQTIDPSGYRQLKKKLPYVTCGIFNPPYRRVENFGWINHFIIDIDHLGSKELEVNSVKSKLISDSRVKMVFTSPGEDGLKVLFSLKEKCYDPGRYSLFYKVFLSSFAKQYSLEQVTDSRTSDVSRACFISHDPEAWYNPDSDAVDMNSFTDFDNPFAMGELSQKIMFEEKMKPYEETGEEKPGKDPGNEALAAIKARLNPNFRIKKEKNIHVPDQIEQVVEEVVQNAAGFGIGTTEVISIHYGKKFRFRLGLKEAEINVFYGKRGYSVVQSPRQGTDRELNEVCSRIIGGMLLQ